MTGSKKSRTTGRDRRRKSIRKGLKGTPDRPRLSVFRSLKHTYAQLIDDVQGATIVAASTLCEDVRKELGNGNHTKTDASKAVGKVIARMAQEKGIKKIRFDRGGYLYHGRVQALADAAREGGLEF